MSETKILASYVVNGKLGDIPGEVLREARRSLVNFMGCAVGGARDEAVDAALQAFRPFSGAPTANVLGRDERLRQAACGRLAGSRTSIRPSR